MVPTPLFSKLNYFVRRPRRDPGCDKTQHKFSSTTL